MKLTRLCVAELRQFRKPLELADLQPGLNLFAGANEAGKSTLVRAIRAAFFERFRSTAVEDLRPWGDSAASPTVELDFRIGDTAYRLRKVFLRKGRCELQIGARRLEGEEAEEHLAALLGFGFAGRGASRPEHGGIPGLLWIEQGAAQELQEPVRHAAAHLQRALDEQLGAVAASGGDALLARVQALRGELRTATGKSRGALQEAEGSLAQARAQVQALDAAARSYREQVDQLGDLRARHAADELARPWEPLQAQLAQAEQALAQAQALNAQRSAQAAEIQRSEELLALLRRQLEADARQQAELARRSATLAQAQAALEPALRAQDAAARALEQAQAESSRAGQALAQARQEETRAQLQRQLESSGAHARATAELLQRARAEAGREAEHRRQAQALALPPKVLQTLRQQDERLQALALQLAGLATRVAYTLQAAAAVTLDGQSLQGEGQQLLTAPAELAIAGVGRFMLAPGGPDLAERRAEQARLQAEHRDLLQRLGLPSRAEADAREQARLALLAQAEASAKALQVLAPGGIAALQSEADRLGAEHAQVQSALAQLPGTRPEPAPRHASTPAPVPTLAAALAAAEDAERLRQAAAQALDAGRQHAAAAQAAAAAAQREHEALAALRADAGLRAQHAQAEQRLVDAQAELAVKQRQLQALDAQIAAARPDILAQDVQRLRRSVEELQRTQRERKLRLVQLEATLAAAGAQGVDEALALALREQAGALRRHEELQRRADALVLLEQTLQAHRLALTQRLRAPLQRHLDHYLALLFPGSRLDIDEQLQPGSLARPGAPATTTAAAADPASAGTLAGTLAGTVAATAAPAPTTASAPFAELSFGAREQLGILTRLAYADLLQQAGRPTLVILDDALVHSDAERLARMKRALYDAAARHQVLLFTCHAERWRDMGVAVRTLPAA
jgi:DNA repair exonuclease SbcCD ATPase subunit